MKRTLLFFFALLMGISGAWAQVVTTWNTAGTPVTKDALVASAGTGAKYAFRMPSNSQPGWCGFNSTTGKVDNIDVDHLFTLENGSDEGKYWLKRVSNNEYLSGDNAFNATTGIDLTLDNRVPSNVNDYDQGYSNSTPFVSFDNSDGNHYNNGYYDFRGGTGGWSVYVIYGPFYIVTVKCVNENNDILQTATYIAQDGTTINSPNLAGLISTGTTSYTVNGADLDITFTYEDIVCHVKLAETASGLPTAAGFGTFSGQTFTTTPGSGKAGVTVTASNGLTIGEQAVAVNNYGNCFKFVTADPSTDYTVTLTAPTGYFIREYHLACSANTRDATHTLTSEDGKVSVVASAPPYNNPTGPKDFTVTGLDAQTTSFTISTANKGNTLYVPQFTVTIVREEFADITYVVKENGITVFTSEPQAMAKGTEITALPDEFKNTLFYDYNTINLTIADANTAEAVFTATPKSDAPVKYTIDTSNPFYYNLKIRGKYIVRQSDNTIKNQDESEPFNPSAAWAFIGNPYGGFRVINQAAGTNYFLMYDEIRIPRHAVECVIMRENDTRTWIIDTNTGGFVLRATEDPSVYLHQRTVNGLSTCSVSEWSAVHNDPGSTIVASTDEQVLIDLYNTMTTTPVGEGVNQYTINNMTLAEYQSTLSGVDAVISGQITSAYADAYHALLDLRSQATFTLNLPEPGFYRIKGNTSGKYLSNGNINADGTKYTVSADADASTIFYFTGSALVNFAKGANVDLPSWSWNTNESALSLLAFHDGLTNGGYAISNGVDKNNNPIFLYDNGNGGTPSVDRGAFSPITASTDARYTSWYLEEVSELPIALNDFGGSYYSTFYSPVNVEVSDATAYTLTLKSNYLSATEISDGVIPANKGVVLVGANAAATVSVTDKTHSADSGVLTGTVATATSSESDYIFTVVDNEIGFYKNGFGTVKGFKAFYRPSDSSVRGFAINFGLNDAITDILHQVSPKNVYDLQGRRVNEPAKGLYIINGKKVIK